MLTSLARASLRRVVSLPLRPLTAPVAARAVLLAPAVRTQQPFGTTSWAHEAAKGKSTKGAASKKKKTTKAAATKAKAKPKAKPKPKPKPKKKKVLTPEEKAKKEVRELKVAALLNEPAKLPGTSWLVYVTQELKGKSVGGDLAGRTRAVREAFRSLSSYELEVCRGKENLSEAPFNHHFLGILLHLSLNPTLILSVTASPRNS